MLMLISPAKTLDYETPVPIEQNTRPMFVDRAAELIEILRKFDVHDIRTLMDVSEDIASLNMERFKSWSTRFTQRNSKQAIFAFAGDVYDGLAADSLSGEAIAYLQSHLRILSGLYGVLRPLDLMQAYRLEMGRRLSTPQGNNLYDFWGDTVTDTLREHARKQRLGTIVNLASEEYFKVVRIKKLGIPVISPVFEDWKAGNFKVISFFAKRARGAMVRYAAENAITKVEDLKSFEEDGYVYDTGASSEQTWVFRRKQTDFVE